VPSPTRSRIETTKRLLQTLREQRVAKFRQTATELEVEFLPPEPEQVRPMALGSPHMTAQEQTLQALIDLGGRARLE
jgi:hypothetical protein